MSVEWSVLRPPQWPWPQAQIAGIALSTTSVAVKALAAALPLAAKLEVKLHALGAEELSHFATTIDEVVEEQTDANRFFRWIVDRSLAHAKAQRVKLETYVVAGHPVTSIVEFVERGGYDLLVIGFMGHFALYNRPIGSTTDLAPCNVLVVK